MSPIDPNEVRYIKLGAGGAWARSCLDRGEMQFGYATVPHEACLAGDWERVAQVLIEVEGRSLGKARDGVREIRDFYTLGADCLWITFADRHLWWAFAEPAVAWLGGDGEEQGVRMRRTVDGWRKVSIESTPLQIDGLSSRFTQVAGYRQTICRVKASDYLIRRINGMTDPDVTRARELRMEMTVVAAKLIAGLHWAEFETLDRRNSIFYCEFFLFQFRHS